MGVASCDPAHVDASYDCLGNVYGHGHSPNGHDRTCVLWLSLLPLSRDAGDSPAVGMTHLGVLFPGMRACYIHLRSGWGSDGNVYNALRG